ncbi:ATP-binding cassette, subfamily F, uup [Cyclonatronum proteinivorum]|uniref:ATP-binding cassette, subfamily F, uup n=1 Tax=Cyclonatronum proteinivorum TaxID=1457365 RepID=A0A345UFY2_9BACT|nr:ABC-F family ATP-binding cassette domain-containing protein [Cyclonatronum proteinivorum]AXI99383.1 ATP-binding cassette, subfamily F, uup [Cyclonatronum proteinivorum]
MTYLSVENLSKSFGIKPLFSGITFGLSRGDKTALVAPNGTGKSTLLKVLAGKETADSGEVMVRNGIRLAWLEQEPALDNALTIREYIGRAGSETAAIIQRYEAAVQAQTENYSEQTQQAFDAALAAMEAAGAWDYEQRMESILSKLGITQLDQSISTLSGGERKRVALAFALLENPDLLLLDEPTNHLDVEMIEWLETWLIKSTVTLLMVTHDRYFLDRICTHIIEIDAGRLYHHKGNYSYYLEKKAERQEIEQVEIGKAGQLLKKELEWMRRSPKARTTKSKSRISAFYETEKKAKQKTDDSQLRLEVSMTRIGGKVLELEGVNKCFGDTVILKDFSYEFQRGERIGIIGRNGVGKSTFLNMLTGEEPVDSGWLDSGTTLVYGHYKQRVVDFDEERRVIDIIKDVAEYIELADGNRISASQFLEHFMFPGKMQYTPVGKLSGGERRRLALMMVLIKNPNFLILDEPTNDLDLITLNRLEEFLLDFKGCLIIVSHDRFFMDKLVQHYFVFEGDGVVRDFNGTWYEYRQEQEALEAEARERKNAERDKLQQGAEKSGAARAASGRKGLSFKERKRYEKLEAEIEKVTASREEVEAAMNQTGLSPEEITRLAAQYAEIGEALESLEIEWLELAERAEET